MIRARFERALRAIEEGTLNGQATRFDMRWWGYRDRCGTALCLAGWAATLAGDPPDFEAPDAEDGDARAPVETVSGETIVEVATRWLGVVDDETRAESGIFYELNARNARELRAAAERLAAQGLLRWTDEDEEER